MSTESRRQAHLTGISYREFQAAVTAWSASDTMRLPTREYLRYQLEEEVDLLIEALGPWADVDPEGIFPDGIWFP